MSDAIIASQIKELVKSGLLVEENGGYLIKRFQEEQGPSQEEKREKWKNHQNKKRGNYIDQDKEKEKEKDKDKDKEVTRVSRVTLLPTLQKNAKEPESSLYLLAMALSEVSGLSFEANKERIFREAKLLSKDPNATPERIRADYGPGGSWYSCDWRGKKGQAPTLEQARSTFGTLNLPKKFKTVGDLQTKPEPDPKELAKLLIASEEARKARIREEQSKEEIENYSIMSF